MQNIVELLRQQAAEIAAEGHPGWGNTMLEAATEIERLRNDLAGMTAAADSLGQDVYSLTENAPNT